MQTPLVGASAPPASTRPDRRQPLVLAAAVGAALAIGLGVYGRLHTPTGDTIWTFGFPTLLAMKSWSTTIAIVLGLGQAATAAWLFGRLPAVGPAPSGLAAAHRWAGTLAFLFTLPAAYHCLWALGFRDTDTRVLVHSILGCAFYGALATKLLVLRTDRLPGWALPAAGGILVATLTGVWLTSSLWFFTNVGFPGW